MADKSVSVDDDSSTRGVSRVRFFYSSLTFVLGVMVIFFKGSCVSIVSFA